MARIKGSMSVSANFEVKAASPVDARYLVNAKTDLTDSASWVYGGLAYVYPGMQVFVKNEKKLYMLMSNNFTQMANWKEISSSTMTDALVYRGTVATRTYLPTTGMVIGDTYYITDETLNVYYDGTNWVDFGSTGKSSYLWKSNTQLTTLATPVTISLTDLTRADNGAITATALDMIIGKTIVYSDNGTVGIVTGLSGTTDVIITPVVQDTKSDGVHLTSTTLSKTIGSITSVTGMTITDLVINETLLYDNDGTIAVVTAETSGTLTATTISTSGEKSDGVYVTTDTLDTIIGNTTTISVSNISGASISNFVVGETLIYDGDGTVGKVVSIDTTNNEVDVETITISGGGSNRTYPTSATLNTTILGTTTLTITDLDTTVTINDLEKEQLVFDKNGTVAKITNIDTTTGDITALTITIAGSGSGGVIGGNFDYDTGYSYTVDVAGTGYAIGDIVPTDIPTVFGKVAEVDTNGEIKAVTFTRKTTTSTTGTGASIKAVLDTNVFVIPDAEWSAGIAIFSLTNDDGAQVEFIRTDDVNTKYNMGADSKYYKFVYDPTEGCIIQSYSEIKGGGGDSKLIRDVKANLTVGAISSGDTVLKDTTFTEFVEKLLIKEVAPAISFTSSQSGVLEVGTIVTDPTLRLQINSLGTGTPTNINFYVGSTLVDTQPYVPGTNVYTYNFVGTITSTSSTKATLDYNKSDNTPATLTATKSYTFVYASYYGAISMATPTDTDVKALTKNVKNTKAFTYNNIALNDERICYAYPVSFGNLTSIKDANNFEYISSYTKYTMTIDSVSYNVYVLTDPITATGFKQIYS